MSRMNSSVKSVKSVVQLFGGRAAGGLFRTLIATLTCTARSLRKTLESIDTPCSVKAKGLCRRPPRPFDLPNWNIKADASLSDNLPAAKKREESQKFFVPSRASWWRFPVLFAAFTQAAANRDGDSAQTTDCTDVADVFIRAIREIRGSPRCAQAGDGVAGDAR
jgi:hypothetical protein